MQELNSGIAKCITYYYKKYAARIAVTETPGAQTLIYRHVFAVPAI